MSPTRKSELSAGELIVAFGGSLPGNTFTVVGRLTALAVPHRQVTVALVALVYR